jgi:hypothetical protein
MDIETLAAITVISTILAMGLFQLRWRRERDEDDDRRG